MLRHSHQRRERNRIERFPIASFRPPIASLYFSFYPANIALPRQMSARTPFLLSVPLQRFLLWLMKSRGPKEAPWEMADSWMLHPPQRLIRLGSHELVQAGVAGKAVE